MKEIPLTKGKFAIVDDADYEELSKHKWCYHGEGYATRQGDVMDKNGKKPLLCMHVNIMGRVSGLEIDHVNGNGLDNRRENLRHVTSAQNHQNQKANREGSSSKYKGVWLRKGGKRWCACIMIGGKTCHLGSYESERDAAWVYNVWAESFFGEYARLNVLEP